MNDNDNLDDIRTVWQNQAQESTPMSPIELRQKAQELQRTIQWRNLREYIGSAIVVAVFGYYYWKFKTPVMRLGSALTIAGALYGAFQLHTRGSATVLPTEMAVHPCLAFHRRELERQRNLLRSVWSWYLLPFVPGLAVFVPGTFVGQAAANPAHAGLAALFCALTLVLCFAVFFAIWKLNQSAARKIQFQIDALAALGSESE